MNASINGAKASTGFCVECSLFRHLTGCHAFLERLRFVSKEIGENLSGLERLRIDFHKRNTLEAIVRTVRYLLAALGDAIERAYDCVYGSYKLNGFGEACVRSCSAGETLNALHSIIDPFEASACWDLTWSTWSLAISENLIGYPLQRPK